MVIGVRTIELHIPGCRSLKEKRFVIKSLRDRLRARLNVSVAEVNHQNLWQRSTIAVAAINQSRAYVSTILEKVLDIVENCRGVIIIDVSTEVF